MKGLVIALQFLTRLPTPRISVTGEEFAASMRWFPAAGLVIGGLVTAGAWLGAGIDPWVAALAALVVWTVVTGALHLDGLSDLADASGAAHKDRERLLAVLADPHVGSFGVVAIALQLSAKLVLLHACLAASAWATLPLVPFAARIGPIAWTRWLPPLHEGLAAKFRMAVRPVDIVFWTIALLLSAWWAPPMLATPLLIMGWSFYLRRTVGGISGDGHGAGIELVETGLLVAIAIWAHHR
jgi:adenosylcobinamide-GDP ribazoletransferase